MITLYTGVVIDTSTAAGQMTDGHEDAAQLVIRMTVLATGSPPGRLSAADGFRNSGFPMCRTPQTSLRWTSLAVGDLASVSIIEGHEASGFGRIDFGRRGARN